MNKQEKKRVISRRNAGLGDNLLATAHAWYYAQQTGRDMEISWVPSMYFKDNSVNSFGYFFKIPDKIGDVHILYNPKVGFLTRLKRRLPLFPAKFFLQTFIGEVVVKLLRNKGPKFIHEAKNKRREWLIDIIRSSKHRPEKEIVFNTHFNFLEPKLIKPFFDAIHLTPKFQDKVDDFQNTHFKDKKVIGVHVRYYDKSRPISSHTKHWLEPDKSFEHIKSQIQKIIAKFDTQNYIIYLATDNEIVFNYFKKNFDNLVTYNKAFQDIKFDITLHHKIAENSYEDDLIEMFLLSYSNVLYRYPPSGSWFSFYGSLYADEVVM